MSEVRRAAVSELQAEGVLLVEDGNHGEYRPRPGEFVDQGVAFIRAADLDTGRVLFGSASRINDRARQRITKGIGAPGDILLSHKGTVGKVALVQPDAPPFVCSPQTTFWRTLRTDVLDRLYLYAYLRSAHFHRQLASRAGETDMAPYVSLTSQRQLVVPLPPITEQRRIARILGALDDKIEMNRRTTETLEATAQSLFKSWFVDSKPDHSDEDGSLEDAVDLLRDLVDPQLQPDTVFQHYSLPAYDAGREAISEPGAGIRSSKLAVPEGSVLLSKLNPDIERVWLPDIRPDDRAICSTEFLVLRPRVGVGRAFVYEFLRSVGFRNTLTSLVTGTTGSHQRAHAEAILQAPLRLPGPSRAAQFERIVGPMLDRIAVARRESRTLVALRDALLPRLLSGEAPSFGKGS